MINFNCNYIKFVPLESAVGQKSVLKRAYLDPEWEPRSNVDSNEVTKTIQLIHDHSISCLMS